MPRCVIVAGGEISDYAHVRSYLKAEDYVVYCDCGLRHLAHLNAKADLVVGDFDSFEKPSIDVEVIALPREKDDTDSLYAIKECLCRGYDEFLLVGMLGGRVDHSLANIYCLLFLYEKNCSAMLVSDTQEMWMVEKDICYIDDNCKYFSLVNISGIARGITIRNAKYELENAEIQSSFQLGISNEVLLGKTAEVSVQEGCVLLIRTLTE
ncbi:MAG: thiamine diphosphokinase [Sphaerochaetaceae bacterium]|nr:thiamine diphosphokinase [Sphaerochaetaceae bacterium]